MTRAELNELRDWVRAEIKAAIADDKEDESGFCGSGYEQNKEADRLFGKVVEQCDERH